MVPMLCSHATSLDSILCLDSILEETDLSDSFRGIMMKHVGEPTHQPGFEVSFYMLSRLPVFLNALFSLNPLEYNV